jgi:hypothetical protein
MEGEKILALIIDFVDSAVNAKQQQPEWSKELSQLIAQQS